jgi:glycerate dehydrogenase
MPKIVILDGYCTNPGDLSWDRLSSLGDCTIHDRTPAHQVIERLSGVSIAVTNKALFPRETLELLPELKYIGVMATGYNIVDVESATRLGITVTNVPVYGTESVAQMVFAHILNLTQRVAQHATSVREGRWAKSEDWSYWDYPLIELSGKTLGIVGYGRIGSAVARIASAFGMKVVIASRSKKSLPQGVEQIEMDDLFTQGDIITLHCPLTPATEGLVNEERLNRMKSTAFLINTGRGPLIDEKALADALNSGQIAGAGIDVLSLEPPNAHHPLYEAKNCFITPHIAWATKASRGRLVKSVCQNIEAFLAGAPVNVVNSPR